MDPDLQAAELNYTMALQALGKAGAPGMTANGAIAELYWAVLFLATATKQLIDRQARVEREQWINGIEKDINESQS